MHRQVHAACVAISVFGGLAAGQIPVTSVGGAPFVEAWVDPCNGSDSLAAINCSGTPYRTVNAAIQAMVGIASSTSPGLVHCDAGIYSTNTNGEQFPIRMRDWIHVQGVGARQCVIRGVGMSSIPVFLPTSNGNCTCGSYANSEVLVDLSYVWDQNEEMLDGFTFQGGDIQVYSAGEMETWARVSNCVFDMLGGDKTVVRANPDMASGVSPAPLAGPSFGMLFVHQYHPGVPYYSMPINILNNTFIMGWTPVANRTVTARRGAVAICDVNNPLCGLPPWQADPDPSLRGIGPLNIQNNLIRTLPSQNATALLGIDSGATTVAIGTPTGPSNAFDPKLVGGMNSTQQYCSKIIGSKPVPRVNINPTSTGGRDAAFVGEMLSRQFGQPLSVSRDWRILPASALVNAGSIPRPLTAGGILAARNGTRYSEPALVPLSSFDLDGEVYGNPRVQPVFGGVTPMIDIGFDETHLMVNCAGNANDSVSHRWNPAVTPEVCGPLNQGQQNRGLVFPTTGQFTLFETRMPIPFPLLPVCAGASSFYPAYTTMWATDVPPTIMAGFPTFYDLLWMTLPLVTTGPAGVVPSVSYTAPNDPVILTFGAAFAPTLGTNPWQFVNEQSLFAPTGSPLNFISNLQSSTD